MRVLILNPNTDVQIAKTLSKAAEPFFSDTIQAVTKCVNYGPKAITTELDELVSQTAVLNYLKVHYQQYDGVIVACFGDPAVNLLKRMLPIPVIGIAEAAYHSASLYSGSFCAISTGGMEESSLTKSMIDRCGLKNKCTGVYPLGIAMGELEKSSDLVLNQLIEKIVTQEDAKSIVLACAALAGMGKTASQKYGIPIYDGIGEAAVLMESILCSDTFRKRIQTGKTINIPDFSFISVNKEEVDL